MDLIQLVRSDRRQQDPRGGNLIGLGAGSFTLLLRMVRDRVAPVQLTLHLNGILTRLYQCCAQKQSQQAQLGAKSRPSRQPVHSPILRDRNAGESARGNPRAATPAHAGTPEPVDVGNASIVRIATRLSDRFPAMIETHHPSSL